MPERKKEKGKGARGEKKTIQRRQHHRYLNDFDDKDEDVE